MKKYIIYGMMALAATGTLTSCDWTDPEAVGNHYDNIAEVNPSAYTEYLKSLREYRSNGHKKVYAWFDNKETFSTQADHVSSVPDSIDVLVLNNPSHVTESTLEEIETKRNNTGIETAYVVDYATIRKAWELAKELGSNTPWADYRDTEVKKQIAYFDKGCFDRLICAYDGRDVSTLTAEQRAEYTADQSAFLGPFKSWASGHAGKGFDFIGIPVNIADMELLGAAGTIFLSESLIATNTSELKYIILRNSVSGVSTDKYAVMTSLPVLDPTKADLGYWGGEYSSWLTARWARTATISAIGLVNLNDDYYNPDFIYPVCRGAIQILNPAAK